MTKQVALEVLSIRRVMAPQKDLHRDSRTWKPTSLSPLVSLKLVPLKWVQVLLGHPIPYHTLPNQFRLHSQHHPCPPPLHKGKIKHGHPCFLPPCQAGPDPTGMRCPGLNSFSRWRRIVSTILTTMRVLHLHSRGCLDWASRVLPGLVPPHLTDQGISCLTHHPISSPSAQQVIFRAPRVL